MNETLGYIMICGRDNTAKDHKEGFTLIETAADMAKAIEIHRNLCSGEVSFYPVVREH
jgi:hypothetical protein